MRTSQDNRLRLPVPKRILSDGQHFARVYGRGNPLILIHGNMGSGFVFDRILDPLMERYTVILPDLPGHGMGPPMSEGFSTDRRLSVEYCFQVMEKLGYGHYIVGGHSLGGIIALQMALDCPEKVSAVIKLDSYICYSDPDAEPKLTLNKFVTNEPFYQTLIDEAMSYGPGVTWHAWFDERKSIGAMSCPVLQLIGESFPGTDGEFATYLKKVSPWHPPLWQVIRVPESGHFIQIEQPDFVSSRIISFLDRI